MIFGREVVLTALDPGNVESVRGWINDPEVNRYMLAGHVPVTPGQERAFFEAVDGSDSSYVFEVHVASDMRLIGIVGVDGVDLRHRRGEIGIMIGEKSEQGRGYGRDAIVTTLRFAFRTLGLHRVSIRAREDNERGLGLYRSIGFAEVGKERDSDFAEGRFFDLFVFDMLDHEFAELHPEA